MKKVLTHSALTLFLYISLGLHAASANESSAASNPQTPALERFEYSTLAMGSGLDFVLYAANEEVAAAAIADALQTLELHSAPINNYARNSQVSQLQGAPANKKLTLSKELFECLQASHDWYARTEGAFDVTQSRLFQIWAQARKDQRNPSQEAIENSLRKTNWPEIALQENDRTMTLVHQGPYLSIDVGGLAVGYLIDLMMESMKLAGVNSAMIDAGGDIIVSSAPPGTQGWTIDVAGIDADSPLICRLHLENSSVTTSGDLNQFGTIDGVRYSHIVDPRIAKPVTQRRSVTVIAKKGIDADAGATSLAALGPVDSFKLIDNMPIQEVYYLTLEGEENIPRIRHWKKP